MRLYYKRRIETTGLVNRQNQLLLDESLPIAKLSRVRVIVIVPEETSFDGYINNVECSHETIDSLKGAFKNCLSSSEDFARQKIEEINLEETK